jgi:WD40 repeat protein
LQRGNRITFLWSEGAASFEPYHLEGTERDNLLKIAAQIHARGAEADVAELTGLGHQLYRAVFRRDASDYGSAEAVRGWLAGLSAAGSIERLEFLGDAPASVPWNYLIDEPPTNPGSQQFWGARFNLAAGRRVNPLRQSPAQVQPTQLCAADPVLLDQLSSEQRASLNPWRDAGRLVHGIASIEDALRAGAPDIFLLLVRFERGVPHLGADGFTLADLADWLAEPAKGNPDPLLILMGCGTAAEQAAWQSLLVEASATLSGLIANETLLSPAAAILVGPAVAQRFAEGKQSLGEVLRGLRQEQAAALTVTAFCPPQMRVVAEGAADAPLAENEIEMVPLPAAPYRPFAAFTAADRGLFFGREEDTLRGALAVDRADAFGILVHGSPAVGKTSYLQAGLVPYLEQECIGYRVLRDRLEGPVAEKDYPILTLRCTNDLAGQFADALASFCAQPLVYKTPAGTEVTVNLPELLLMAATGTRSTRSTSIQSMPDSAGITPLPGVGENAVKDAASNWRQHPRVQARLNPDYPDDIQVLVHDGGPRMSEHRPELVWVRVTDYDGVVFSGEVLNQPTQLDAVKKGTVIQFLVPAGGEHPIQVTPKYVAERGEWIIAPCDRCGLTELFDAPSDLLPKIFPNLPPGGVTEMFTTFCGACGGMQLVQHKDVNLPGNEGEGMSLRDLWVVLRDDHDALGRILDAITRSLPFELVIAIDQGEELLTHVLGEQQQSRRQKAIDMLVRLSAAAPRCKIVYVIRTQWLGQLASLFPDGRTPADWRPFYLRPLTGTEMADALLWPTNREAVPYGGEVPHQKYGFAFEDGLAAQIVVDAREAGQDDLVSPLSLVQAAGALLFETQVVQRKHDVLRSTDLKDLGGVKNAVNKYLDLTLEKLPVSTQAMAGLRDLIGKLHLSHTDGTLSRDIILMTQLKERWTVASEDAEAIIEQAAAEQGLFEVADLLIGGQSDTYVGLPQDSLAQLGRRGDGQQDRDAYARTKVIDTLWIMIPLIFLGAAITYYVTRTYFNNPSPEKVQEEYLEKLRPKIDKFVQEGQLQLLRDAYGEIYRGEISQIAAAVRAGNAQAARQILQGQRDFYAKNRDAKMPDLRGFEWRYLWQQINNERKLIDGHRAAVTTVAVAANGSRGASADQDGVIRVWKLPGGESLVTITGPGPVHAIAFAPDGKTLASAGTDKIVRLWDLADLPQAPRDITKETKALTGHTDAVHAVAFGSDANTLASGGADKAVILWDVAAGKERKKLQEHTGAVRTLAFTPDGKTLVSAGDESRFILWDVGAGTKRLDGKTTYASIAAVAAAGTQICTAGVETQLGVGLGILRFWSSADGKETLKPIHHDSAMRALAFASDGKTVYGAATDRIIRQWNVATGQEEKRWIGHFDTVNTLAFPGDGSTLISASADKTVRLWDLARPAGPDVIQAHGDWVQALAIGRNDTVLASGARDGSIKLWDARTNKLLHEIPKHKGAVTALAFSSHKDSAFLAVGTRDDKNEGAITIWQIDGDPVKGLAVKQTQILKEHKKGITCLDFCHAEDKADILISGSADQTVKVWDIKAGKEKASHHGHNDEVRCVTFSFDDRTFASGGKDGLVCFYELDRIEVRKLPNLQSGSIEAMSLFPILSRDAENPVRITAILTGGTDQVMRLTTYNQRERELNAKVSKGRSFRSHLQPITSIAFAMVHQERPGVGEKGEDMLVSAGWDGAIRIYDLAGERLTLTGHVGAVRAIVVGDDFLASAGNDGTIRIWRAPLLLLGM